MLLHKGTKTAIVRGIRIGHTRMKLMLNKDSNKFALKHRKKVRKSLPSQKKTKPDNNSREHKKLYKSNFAVLIYLF